MTNKAISRFEHASRVNPAGQALPAPASSPQTLPVKRVQVIKEALVTKTLVTPGLVLARKRLRRFQIPVKPMFSRQERERLCLDILALEEFSTQKEQEVGELRLLIRRLIERQDAQNAALEALHAQVGNIKASVAQDVIKELRELPLAVADEAVTPDRPLATRLAGEGAAEREWQALVQKGEAGRIRWLQEGLLVPSGELARTWGRTPQALSQATKRGELLALKIKGNCFYPAAFKALEAEVVKDVCSRLKGDDASGKFIFWTRPHGLLGELTPADAILAGYRDKVAALADAWSAERGLAH